MFCTFDAAGLKSETLRSVDLCLSGPDKKLIPNRHLFHKGSANSTKHEVSMLARFKFMENTAKEG